MAEEIFDVPLASPLDYRPSATVGGLSVPPTTLPALASGSSNCLFESEGAVKRPAFKSNATSPVSNPTTGVGTWSTNYYSVISGTGVYKNATGPVIGAVGGSVGDYYSVASAVPVEGLMFLDGKAKLGDRYDAGTFSAIVDATWTGTIAPNLAAASNCVCLNGTFYVMDKLGHIWGSSASTLNTAANWDATNVINAWNDSSVAMSLAVYRNNLIAFKQNGLEVFYDAGIFPGSSLAPNQAIRSEYGLYDPASVAQVDASMFWVGTEQGLNIVVCRMTGAQFEKISTPAVERILYYYLQGLNIGQSVAGLVWGCAITFPGHSVYCISSLLVPFVLCFDTRSQQWGIWNFIPSSRIPNYLPFVGSAFRAVGTGTAIFTYQAGLISTRVDEFADNVWDYTNSVNVVDGIQSELVTQQVNCGTDTYKVCSRLTVLSDQAVNGDLDVAWSDDDMKSWSSWQTMDLTGDQFFLTDLGTFKRRQFRFKQRSSTPLRIKSVKMHCFVGAI